MYLIRHIKRWNKWRKRCANSTWHKILVLFGIRKSPTLPLVRTDDEESIEEAFWRGFRDGISGREMGMTREEAIKTLKENYCAMCAYGSQCMESCDIRSCDNRDAIKVLEQEPTTKNDLGVDAVSRQEVLELIADYDLSMGQVVKGIHALPPVTPIRPKGHWIYDKSIYNWVCSKCGETPKTLGFVGTDTFMAEHFKYCNHCGADMREVEE